jgi:hypothetical protein
MTPTLPALQLCAVAHCFACLAVQRQRLASYTTTNAPETVTWPLSADELIAVLHHEVHWLQRALAEACEGPR